MHEHIRTDDDHPRGPESSRIARHRRRDARRHRCDIAEPDRVSELERSEHHASQLSHLPKLADEH